MRREAFFLNLGNSSIKFFTSFYVIFSLFLLTLYRIPKLWFYRRQFIKQLYSFSVDTLPIAAVLAIFVGLGSTVQGVYQSSGYVPRYFTINVIFKTTVIETSPVILALVLSGKIGAAVAAEIGSMRITEQIDALETMSLCPIGILVVPKVIAALIMFPVMILFANFLAMFGSFFVSAVLSNWISPSEFISGMKMDFRVFEVTLGSLIKPATFGVLISLIGSYFGLHITGGARGVVLISFINEYRQKGIPLREAILEAAPLRVRPILMTQATTILGLLPLAINWGEGGDMLQPMAVAVIGGLFFSLFVTLLLLPNLYFIFEKGKISKK